MSIDMKTNANNFHCIKDHLHKQELLFIQSNIAKTISTLQSLDEQEKKIQIGELFTQHLVRLKNCVETTNFVTHRLITRETRMKKWIVKCKLIALLFQL
jgi:hypothetical protein